MNKIITKILISIILCSIMVAVSIGFLSVLHASKDLRQEAYDKLHYASSNYANEFSAILKNTEGTVDTLESVVASSFDLNQFTGNHNYQSEYMKRIDDLLKKVSEQSTKIQGLYIIINPELTGHVFESWFINDGEGHFINQEPEDISTFFPTNEDMAWYYKPITKKEGVWIPPYADATINVKMISYTKAIFNEGLLIGVVGIDLAFEDIEKTIGNMKLYESGDSFLLNTDYTIILHPYLETGTSLSNIENEDLTNVVESMKKNKSDVIEYVFKSEEKIMGFSKLSNGWILGVSTITADILSPIDRLKNSIKISVVFLLIITGIIGLFISKSITAPINRLRDMAALISQGQHDIELDLNSNNEIGELSKSIHIMTKKLVGSHEELKESEEFLNAIIENIPDMIFLKEAKKLQFAKLNKAGEELLGYSRKELIGKNDYDFFPKEEADIFTDQDRKVLNSRDLKDIPEELIQTKYKGKRTLHTKKIPIYSKEGIPTYLLGISEDITERNKVEKQLLQSNYRLKRAQSVGKVGHWEYDPVNDVIYGSDEYYKIFGSTPEKHKNLNDFISSVHPEDADYMRTKVDATLNKKEPYIADYRIVLPDSSIKFIHVQAEIKFDHNDIPIQMFGSLMDVTELKIALDEVKILRGLIPICSQCKKIRDDKGYWNNIETYIQTHSEASFSHGMCSECSDELYGKEDWYIKMKNNKGKK